MSGPTPSSYRQVPQLDPGDSGGLTSDTTVAIPSNTSSDHAVARKATLRIYWLTAVLCCGGALFGYDSGVIGGVLTFDSFKNDFNFTNDEKTRVSSIAVGIQQAGALVGCFAVWPLTNRRGRRLAMMLCSGVFCAGVVLETIRSGSLMVFYLGRTICGLGIGGSATIIPIYLGEMSPKEIRARLGSCYQFTFTIGILISYWVDYAVVKLLPPSSSKQWQIPMALQLVPGALMGLGMLTVHESVRWLLFRSANSHEQSKALEGQAWTSLAWIRGGSTDEVYAEFNTIKTGVKSEVQTRVDFHLSELITHKPNLRRLFLGFTIFLAQQSTGATALAYFGPQFFAMLVGPGDKNLLLTGVFGGVKVIACFVFVAFVAERFGRRPCLIYGALVMSVCMVITAFVVKANPPPEPLSPSATEYDGGIPTAGLITVLLIYLNIIAFNLSWGPLPWPCISEIFPTRIREPGVAFGVASQWLFNFLWSSTTPYIMAGIGWATFLLFGILDLLFAGFVFGFLMETKGKTLEEITALFEGPSYIPLDEDDDGFKGSDRDEQPLYGHRYMNHTCTVHTTLDHSTDN